MRRILVFATLLACSSQVSAQADIKSGLEGALKGCETWILDPSSWIDGPSPFLAKLGLGDRAGFVSQVSEPNLPPPQLRRANHYLRINSTATAGYVLVVSDQMPMCHITGGGQTDFQPVVEEVLASSEFAIKWKKISQEARDGMVTSEFRNKQNSMLSIIISRADAPNQRQDRVQLIATAQYDLIK